MSDTHHRLSRAYTLYKNLQLLGLCESMEEFIPIANYIFELTKNDNSDLGKEINNDLKKFIDHKQ